MGYIGQVNGKTVALVRDVGAVEEDCRKADIVIAPFKLGRLCNARVVIDRTSLKVSGAHALYFGDLSIRTETIAQRRGKCPRAGSPVQSSAQQKRGEGASSSGE